MTEPTPIQRKLTPHPPSIMVSDAQRLIQLREKLQRLLSGANRVNDEILTIERRLEQKAA